MKPQSKSRSPWHKDSTHGIHVVIPDLPTRFELIVERLGLFTESDMEHSEALHQWCRANCTRAYVPEYLLHVFHLDAKMKLYFSSDACAAWRLD